MNENIGKTDRTLRIVVGAGIILAGIITQSWWGAVGIVPLLTALTGFCPLYPILRISTCERSCSNEKPVKTGNPKH
jgi:hypothetical protein